jgi:hypothetical protein
MIASAWSSAVQSQTLQDYSIQGSAIFVIAGGNAFAGTEAGPGVELQLRRNISQLTLGVGFQYSRHDFLDFPDPLNLVGFFLEPRWALPGSSSTWAPYVSGRLAVFRQALSTEGVGASATGGLVNGGGGILVRLTRNTNLDLGATFGVLRFGQLTWNLVGGSQQYPASTGTNLVLRAGLAIGLGS